MGDERHTHDHKAESDRLVPGARLHLLQRRPARDLRAAVPLCLRRRDSGEQQRRVRPVPAARDPRADRRVRELRYRHRAGAGAAERRDRPAAVDANGTFRGSGRTPRRRHRPDAGDDPDHLGRRLRGRIPVHQRRCPGARHDRPGDHFRAGDLLYRGLHRPGHRRRGVCAVFRADLAVPADVRQLRGIAWLAGIFIVFAPLAVRAYKRAA